MQFLLRKATIEDSQFLIETRNHPENVRLSASRRIITQDEHQDWLHRILKEKKCLPIIIVEKSTGKRCGYARIDQNGSTGSITIVLINEIQGQGWGPVIIRDVARMGTETLEGLKEIKAVIRAGNKRSERAFRKAGFISCQEYQEREDGEVELVWRSRLS